MISYEASCTSYVCLQSSIYIETFRTDRSVLKASRGKKRPLLEVLSDFQVDETGWENDCLILMDELLKAPNSWLFRDSACTKGCNSTSGTMDNIRARLLSRTYANALEWATDVRQLLSSYLPQRDENDIGCILPNLGTPALDKDTAGEEEYTDRQVFFYAVKKTFFSANPHHVCFSQSNLRSDPPDWFCFAVAIILLGRMRLRGLLGRSSQYQLT